MTLHNRHGFLLGIGTEAVELILQKDLGLPFIGEGLVLRIGSFLAEFEGKMLKFVQFGLSEGAEAVGDEKAFGHL